MITLIQPLIAIWLRHGILGLGPFSPVLLRGLDYFKFVNIDHERSYQINVNLVRFIGTRLLIAFAFWHSGCSNLHGKKHLLC